MSTSSARARRSRSLVASVTPAAQLANMPPRAAAARAALWLLTCCTVKPFPPCAALDTIPRDGATALATALAVCSSVAAVPAMPMLLSSTRRSTCRVGGAPLVALLHRLRKASLAALATWA